MVNNERNANCELGYDRTLSIATMTFNGGNGAADDSLSNYKVIRVGDIAFEGHTNKAHAYGRFVLNDAGDGLMSPRFSCLRPIVEQRYSFWKYYIPREESMRPILVNATKSGTMMNELVPDDLMHESILVPCLAEQEVIGNSLSQLNHLITLHQRKRKYRGLYGYLSWEQRKLGEVASEFQSGEFISATEITENGDYPVYGGNGLRGYANRYNHEGFYALIGRQGALCGNVNCADGKAYFAEHAVAVQANQCNDTGFLVYLLSRMNLGQYSGQSAQPGLAVSTLKEVETLLPSKYEQYRIGSLLKDLDSLITLHQ